MGITIYLDAMDRPFTQDEIDELNHRAQAAFLQNVLGIDLSSHEEEEEEQEPVKQEEILVVPPEVRERVREIKASMEAGRTDIHPGAKILIKDEEGRQWMVTM